MKRVLSIILVLSLVVCFTAVLVHAQSADTSGTGTATTDDSIDLSLTTFPINPQPLDTVTITAQSYGVDITQANLVWTDNGKVIASGIGRTQISVTAPTSGNSADIAVTASGAAFNTTTADVLLRPGSVDLLWEGADSYTPPFYKGRALPSSDGIIRITAVPAANAPKNLTYAWTENDDAIQSQSGYNKSSIVIKNSDLISTENIAVTETNGAFSGSSSVAITPGDPSLVGYFNTDGYIDYANGSVDSLSTTDTGANIHFEPYYFSVPNNIQHDLGFAYTDSEGNGLPPSTLKNEIALSRPDGGGQSQFSVAITTIAYSLQNLSRVFSINFN